MHPRFAKAANSLDSSYRALLKMKPITIAKTPKDMPAQGIYLFSEGRKHLYVGRSNKLHKRPPPLRNASDGSIRVPVSPGGYGFPKAKLQER
jgi:hypothetical protein